MTGLVDDPLTTILRSKRESTRFQCLVEIAEHQPAVRQLEIAERLGITPQAVSEYIRELVDDGMVASQGRGRYEVTREGIEWVLTHAEQLETYARHVRRDLIQQVSVWAAIASEDLDEGEIVGVFMRDGLRGPRTPVGQRGRGPFRPCGRGHRRDPPLWADRPPGRARPRRESTTGREGRLHLCRPLGPCVPRVRGAGGGRRRHRGAGGAR